MKDKSVIEVRNPTTVMKDETDSLNDRVAQLSRGSGYADFQRNTGQRYNMFTDFRDDTKSSKLIYQDIKEERKHLSGDLTEIGNGLLDELNQASNQQSVKLSPKTE